MERRYRAVTLKRNQQKKQILVILLLVFVGSQVLVASKSYITDRFMTSFKQMMEPNIVKYSAGSEGAAMENQAPFILYLIAPTVLSYTYTKQDVSEEKEELEVQAQELVDTMEVVTLPSKQVVEITLDYEQQVSLLQENLQILEGEEFTHQENATPILTVGATTQTLDLSIYQDFDKLIKDFYVVDASTAVDEADFNINTLTAYDCSIDMNTDGPQILIYHSHGLEDYADSVDGDPSTTIIGAGERLAELLEGYGFNVLHHVAYYDLPSRDYAYSNALPEIEQILADNPTITTVIDLHRDGVADDVRLVQTIDGKDYAQFMYFNGVCQTVDGPIDYLENPYLSQNLAFSFQAQLKTESYFPGITRKIYLKAWRYNQHLVEKNMLIELGAQTNTIEEALNTCEIIALVIYELLSGQ
ncbi:MAG: stage II sporulation protein P [Lachnospiraceae bacterium]